jgi:ribonuclease HI
MFIVYTDGACRGNPGPGGWGSTIIIDNNKMKDSENLSELVLKFLKNYDHKIYSKFYFENSESENSNLILEIGGNDYDTTNNRMEMMSVIKSLELIRSIKNLSENLSNLTTEIELFTDSTYVKDGIEKWIHNWQKNGWKTANKQPVKNYELWQKIYLKICRKMLSGIG